MEKKRPDDDKNSDRGIADPFIFSEIKNDNDRYKTGKQAVILIAVK